MKQVKRVSIKQKPWYLSFEFGMMLPALILLATISLVPLVYIIWMSLNDISLLGGISFHWVGLKNWVQMFTDVDVQSSWYISLKYFVTTVGIELILGVAIALLLHELAWYKNPLLSLLLMPMLIAPSLVGLLGRFMLDPTYGLYSWLLNTIGLFKIPVFGLPDSAFWAVVLMDVWEWTPLITLITLAGLVLLPQELHEASKVDGANYWQHLRRVIFPLISGIVFIAFLIRSMDAIRYFALIWLATNGGPADATKIIPLRLYEQAFSFFHLGYAAAIGLGMLAFSTLVATLLLRILQQRNLV